MNHWTNRRKEKIEKVQRDLRALAEQVRRYLAIDLNDIKGPTKRYLKVRFGIKPTEEEK